MKKQQHTPVTIFFATYFLQYLSLKSIKHSIPQTLRSFHHSANLAQYCARSLAQPKASKRLAWTRDHLAYSPPLRPKGSWSSLPSDQLRGFTWIPMDPGGKSMWIHSWCYFPTHPRREKHESLRNISRKGAKYNQVRTGGDTQCHGPLLSFIVTGWHRPMFQLWSVLYVYCTGGSKHRQPDTMSNHVIQWPRSRIYTRSCTHCPLKVPVHE